MTFHKNDDYSFVNTSPKEKEKCVDLYNLILKVNLVRDSMDNDKTNVIPINFSKIGII